jgi:hypothetical protein
MRNNQSNIDDPILESYRRYLLGGLDEAEAEDFERQLLMEPDLDVEALDGDLIAACIRGEFPPEESQRLLARLTSPPAGWDRRGFHKDLTTIAGEARTRPRNSVIPFLRRRTENRQPSNFLRAAVAAALLLAVGGITLREGMVTRVAHPPAVFSLALGAVRSHNEIPQLAVPPETERVEIRIDVAGEEYPSYSLVLTDGSGKEVAEKSGVLPRAIDGTDILSFELAASSLRNGEDYRLDVYGTEANGLPELLGAPEFEIQTD